MNYKVKSANDPKPRLIEEVFSNLTAYIMKEADCPASADTHLNQAIFAAMQNMSKDELLYTALARGQVYYAFKECSTYGTPDKSESMIASISLRQFYQEKFEYKLRLEEDFVYHEGEEPWGIGYFSHPPEKPAEFYVKKLLIKGQLMKEQLTSPHFFTFYYNFDNPNRPPYYIQSKTNASL